MELIVRVTRQELDYIYTVGNYYIHTCISILYIRYVTLKYYAFHIERILKILHEYIYIYCTYIYISVYTFASLLPQGLRGFYDSLHLFSGEAVQLLLRRPQWSRGMTLETPNRRGVEMRKRGGKCSSGFNGWFVCRVLYGCRL